jgi:hypothetical protein
MIPVRLKKCQIQDNITSGNNDNRLPIKSFLNDDLVSEVAVSAAACASFVALIDYYINTYALNGERKARVSPTDNQKASQSSHLSLINSMVVKEIWRL